jgi:ATP-dependent helicase/nuclease subunit B
MFYTIHFGLSFDNALYPKPDTEGGALYVGPKGLLHFFEEHLGLSGHIERIEHIRTEQYRQALTKYLRKTPSVFYRASFEADQLACAEALLARRDELIYGGWDFKKNTNIPPRLKVMVDIEQSLTNEGQGVSKLLLGVADRFEAVIQALDNFNIPIESIYINEPFEILPPQYKRLFEALKNKQIVFKEKNIAYNTLKNNDLNIFKKFIKEKTFNTEKEKLNADGSLILIEAKRDTDAADYISRLLKRNVAFRPTFLIPDKNRILDDALIQNGLPSFGLPSASLGRPTLQLLKLVTTFLWRPIDPYKILEFVTLATKPLDSDLGTVIANLMSQRPGIGSDQWFYETTRFFEVLEEKALTDNNLNINKIKNQYDFWFDRPTYDVEKSAPKDEIIEIFNFLREWAIEEFENSNSKNTSLIVLSEQAKRIEEFLEELPPSENFLTYLELERIIRTIYEPAPIQPKPCELGHYPYIHQGSCLLQPVDTLIYWNFTDTEGVHFFSKWYKDELQYLDNQGVMLNTPQNENALMLWERVQGILKTNEKLILIYPKKVNGKDTVEHPLMSHLNACFHNLPDIIFDIDTPDSDILKMDLPQKVGLKYHRLGKINPFIELNTRQLTQRQEETLTSLETLFYYPYQWVFRHKAKLSKSHILSIVKENTLKGNVAHRFFEDVLKENFQNWTREDVNEWVDQRSRRLFQREAATLMMYGYEPERVQLTRQLKYAIWTLISHIRRNNWQVEGTEMDLKGQFSQIPVKGKADVVLLRGSEQCILDLKWSGHSYRERLIKNGEDLQLVMYSRLLKEETQWAHTAYYIIENARLISRNTLAFNEIRTLLPDVDSSEKNSQIWAKMEKTYHWRQAQIKDGKIEIRTEKTAKELEEIYGHELLDVLEMKADDAKFDDYRTLIGLVV